MSKKIFFALLVLALGAVPPASANDALNRLNSFFLQNGDGTGLLYDNPADYAVYEKMDAIVRGLGKSIDNQGDWNSYLRVEDSALGEMVEVEQRIRELLVQRSSGILSSSDRDIIDSEISQWAESLIDILKGTEFNTIKIFAPLIEDPALTQAMTDPSRMTLAGVDSLLEFLSQQRTIVGAQSQSLGHAISGDQIAQENTQNTVQHMKLLAHLLMLN